MNEQVKDYESAKSSDLQFFAEYYKQMAENGVFLPPSQFEGIFLSTEHSEEDIENTIKAAQKAFKAIKG